MHGTKINMLLVLLAHQVGIEAKDIVDLPVCGVSENFIDIHKKYPLKFVHISGKITNPAYQMWLMRHEKLMYDGCYIVFTNIKESAEWRDLTKVYYGSRFGSLYFMVFSQHVKPSVCPSQRGLYMK